MALTGGSLADPDVWWHVRTGRLILDERTIPSSDPFSFTAPLHSWVPTAWLSDVLFGAVWKVSSYQGIRFLRIAMAVAVLLAVWRLAQRHSASAATGAASAALVILTLSPFLVERPQVLSFLFVCWLSTRLQAILRGESPPLLLMLGICWVWANVHGMWVVLPAFVMATGVFAWCEDRSRVPLAARCTLIALLGGLVAALTPVGPRLVLWPLVVSRVAAPISEWQPTVPLSAVGIPFLALLIVIMTSWARSTERTPVGRLLFVLAVAGFGLSAFRNVAPASIMLLPEAATALAAILPSATEPRSSRSVNRVVGAAALVGLLLAGIRLTTTPTITTAEPRRIAAELRTRTPAARVLNSYNVGGFLTGLATPGAKVGIDGRTDIWSATYVADYLTDISGRGDWRALVDRLRPTAAVVPKDSEIARGLVLERGWVVTMTDRGWSLLEPKS